MRKQYVWKLLCCLLLMTAIVCTAVMPIAGQGIIQKECNLESVAAFNMTKSPTTVSALPFASLSYASQNARTQSRGVLSPEELQDLYLCPGGMPFGVKFYTDGVTVVGYSDV